MVDTSNRAAYVVRANIHNHGWDGTVCTNPTRHDDCHASAQFKADHCALNEPRCFFLALFQPGSPCVRLPKRPNNQPTYERVFAAQHPQPGDLVIFWGTYSDGQNYPIGLWEVDSFADDGAYDYEIRGRSATAVQFAPRTANWPVVDNSLSRAVGGDMIRLLPAERLHTVLRRWSDDHEAEMTRLRQLGSDTDPARMGLEGLRSLFGVLPSTEAHLTHRPFERLVDLPVVDVSPQVATDAARALETMVPAAVEADPLATFPAEVVDDYRVAVEVSPLVVLAGPSGAGKTKLTSAFAKSISARYLLVAVRPDWHSNEDLLGYLPPFGEDFVPSAFTEFVLEASEEWEAACSEERAARRFHVCLDEMNLARPEYYMAEILSRMELEAGDRNLHLYDSVADRGFVRTVPMPPNLTLIGTVNNDDSTHALSPKVLDRSAYLLVDTIDLGAWFRSRPERLASEVSEVLIEIDGRLAPTGMRVGYRAAQQVLKWVSHARMNGMNGYASLDSALDVLIFARIRVQRSEPGHREMLDQLVTYLAQSSLEGDEIFPRSLASVRRLRERIERHEFAYGQFET